MRQLPPCIYERICKQQAFGFAKSETSGITRRQVVTGNSGLDKHSRLQPAGLLLLRTKQNERKVNFTSAANSPALRVLMLTPNCSHGGCLEAAHKPHMDAGFLQASQISFVPAQASGERAYTQHSPDVHPRRKEGLATVVPLIHAFCQAPASLLKGAERGGQWGGRCVEGALFASPEKLVR